ncbi:nuclear transport factor 2 family protein [Micromonospora sp. NPDC048898]|uniref:nuclear transport factor 2 family protein n=1 Tax=Micromonospora sp. NPDC048898 TaxID=3364260 RepID=UPI003710D3BF
MPDEMSRKAVVLEYCRRINSRDVEGVVALFADGARVDDPVGRPAFTGRAELRAHIAELVAAGTHETPGTPVATLDGTHVAVPMTVTTRPPQVPPGQVLRLSLIAVLSIGADGLIERMQVYSGRTDMTLTNTPAAQGASHVR